MTFTIVIPFYDGHSTIHRLIKSIPTDINILVIDDFSSEPLTKLDYSNVKIIKGTEKGYFAGAVNLGIQHTRGDVLVLNQDTYFTGNGWLFQLETALKEGYSYIGERIKGTRKDWPKGYIHGTFMYLTRELIDKTGLLNQRDFPMWGCTAEYQLRAARNGFSIKPLETVTDFVHIRKVGERFGESFNKLIQIEHEKLKLFSQTPPLVSVVIPVHNYSKWLVSTINSLVGGDTDLGHWPQQSFAAFEVVIIDDSSTDNTPDIIKQVVNPWKGVRYIRLNRPRELVWDNVKDKYIGKVAAMNEGISEAFGRYIMVLDADDMMRPDRIERFYRAQIDHPHSFIYDNLQLFGGGEILDYTYPDEMIIIEEGGKNTRTKHPKAGMKTKFPKVVDYDFETLIYKNHVHNAIMFPASAFAEIGGYPKRFIYGREDWAIAVKFGVHGYCGYRLPDYHGLLYRREGQNRTLKNTTLEWMKYFQSQMYKEFENIYRGDRPMGCCGNGARATRNQAFANRTRFAPVSSEGTTWLTYTGRRTSGAFNTWGWATGTQYRVTPGTPFRADNKDLFDSTRQSRGLLEKTEPGGRIMFAVHETKEEKQPEPETIENTVIQQEAIVVQDFLATASGFSGSDEFDVSFMNGTVDTINRYLRENEYTSAQLTTMLAFELNNKNRKTVIANIEEKLID